MNKISYQQLYELYVVEKLPMWKISEVLKVAIGTVFNYLKKYNIKTRSQSEAMKGKKLSIEQRMAIGRKSKGRKHSPETRKKMSEAKKIHGQGHKKQRRDGYVYVYFPEHPKSTKDGYIMEHILVIEKSIGRHLEPNECVHHINENKKDNRVENLKLMTKSEHMRYHTTKRWQAKRGGMTY